MSKANNYDVVLEKVGNQPLKTTKILCETLGLGLAKAKALALDALVIQHHGTAVKIGLSRTDPKAAGAAQLLRA